MPGMIEVNHAWTSTGSTSGWNTPLMLDFACSYAVMTCANSSIGTTNSFQFQVAIESSGPWFVEASTACAGDGNGGGAASLRVTGPFTWVRPVLKTVSTGAYTIKLLGVS